MKKVLIALSLVALGLSSCDQKAATTPANGEAQEMKPGTKISTVSDSLSYAIGAEYGRYLVNAKDIIGSDLNEKMVLKAINDLLAGKQSMTPEEGFAFMQEYFTVTMPERNLSEGIKFLEEVEKQPNVHKTESGLLYEIIVPGSDKKATKLSDEVKVKYRGTLRDGREFDSNYEKADTARFALQNVIKGWGEGLQLVGEGGKIKLYIPSELAYGKRGCRGTIIGANEPLVFEVDLIEVIPAAEEEPAK